VHVLMVGSVRLVERTGYRMSLGRRLNIDFYHSVIETVAVAIVAYSRTF